MKKKLSSSSRYQTVYIRLCFRTNFGANGFSLCDVIYFSTVMNHAHNQWLNKRDYFICIHIDRYFCHCVCVKQHSVLDLCQHRRNETTENKGNSIYICVYLKFSGKSSLAFQQYSNKDTFS